tara:strand:+ start:154 stop:750 length:597 start_codon:yes stop_codon:yes gene_type:complete
MAIFRPVMSTGNSFFGICEINILSYKDRSNEFDWADVFIDVTVQQKGSEYTRNIKLAGSFDKDPEGNITGGSVLKRMYTFFDAIGCKAGLNVKGEWETEDGTKIENIEEYLNTQWINPNIDENDPDYIAYVYKEKPKKVGDKAWTRVYHKIYKNNEANKAKLADDVKWLKGKGVIKEATDEPSNSFGNTLQGSGLDNL